MTRENKQAVADAIKRWSAHDDGYFDLYAPDAPVHGLPPEVPPTVEGMKGMFRQMWTAFPDMALEVTHLLGEDDLVAVNLRLTGTHQGDFMGAKGTGRHVDVPVIALLRFGADGHVTERWGLIDETGFLGQLGLLPPPAPAQAPE